MVLACPGASSSRLGVQATLNARTAILAAANPIGGRYDRSKPLRYNVGLPPAILSRWQSCKLSRSCYRALFMRPGFTYSDLPLRMDSCRQACCPGGKLSLLYRCMAGPSVLMPGAHRETSVARFLRTPSRVSHAANAAVQVRPDARHDRRHRRHHGTPHQQKYVVL